MESAIRKMIFLEAKVKEGSLGRSSNLKTLALFACRQRDGVLIPISLGYDNIDSPAARRGESGSTAGFVCDCFEEELAGALRYGKLDGITPGSVRGLALGSSSAGCSRAVARHRTSSTRGHIDQRRARTDQSRPRPDDR